MARPIQEPVTDGNSSDAHGSYTRHPAFGQVAVRHISGRDVLYGSDFVHHRTVGIVISASILRRDLHRDWHYDDKELIAIEMSEAQWATMISSPNIGGGVPCTIRHIQGEMMPGLPDPAGRTEQFAGEMKDRLHMAEQQINRAIDMIDKLGLPKAKAAALKQQFTMAKTQVTANVPYVAQCFSEHMEGEVEKAKSEIHGYMMTTLARAGLEHLQSQAPLQIKGPEEDEE